MPMETDRLPLVVNLQDSERATKESRIAVFEGRNLMADYKMYSANVMGMWFMSPEGARRACRRRGEGRWGNDRTGK